MTAKALKREKPMNKEQQNQQSNQDENQEEDAVSLFNQINNTDSKDSENDVEKTKLDQDDDTDREDNAGEDADEQGDEDKDPWADAPEPLRNQYQTIQQANQKLQNDFQSVNGRLAPMQRELEALKKQVVDRDKQTGGETAKEVPTTEELSTMSDDEIESEFPEVAAFIRQRDKQFQQQIDERFGPLQKLQSNMEEQERQQSVQSGLDRVAQAHPDFQKVVADPSFNTWLNVQPNAIRRIAESMDAEDNIALLNLYKGQLPPAAKPQTKKSLSQHVEMPRKGNGRGLVNYDDADPVALFNKLNS